MNVISLRATDRIVARLRRSSLAAATSFTMARFRPSEEKRCNVSEEEAKSDETPMPDGPRRYATNFPRVTLIRI